MSKTHTIPATPAAEAVATLAVTKVVPSPIPAGFVPIVASTRAAKNGPPIPEDQRRRVVLAPELTPNVPSKFLVLVTGALDELRKEILADRWAKEPNLTEIPAAIMTEDAVLSFYAAKNEAGRLTTERIKEWLALPNIAAAVAKRANPERAKAVLLSAASPAMQLRTVEQCDAVSAILTSAEDDDTIAAQIRARVQRIRAEFINNAEAF